MDPISTIKSIITIAVEIKAIADVVEKNKASAGELATRIDRIVPILREMKGKDKAEIENSAAELNDLADAVTEARDLLESLKPKSLSLFGKASSIANRVLNRGGIAEAFIEINERLDRILADLVAVKVLTADSGNKLSTDVVAQFTNIIADFKAESTDLLKNVQLATKDFLSSSTVTESSLKDGQNKLAEMQSSMEAEIAALKTVLEHSGDNQAAFLADLETASKVTLNELQFLKGSMERRLASIQDTVEATQLVVTDVKVSVSHIKAQIDLLASSYDPAQGKQFAERLLADYHSKVAFMMQQIEEKIENKRDSAESGNASPLNSSKELVEVQKVQDAIGADVCALKETLMKHNLASDASMKLLDDTINTALHKITEVQHTMNTKLDTIVSATDTIHQDITALRAEIRVLTAVGDSHDYEYYPRTGGKGKEGALLGGGAFGKTYLMRNKSDNGLYCVKSVEVTKVTSAIQKELENELKTLKNMFHTNIVRYYGSFTSNEQGVAYFNFVMEYISGGSMRDFIISMTATTNPTPKPTDQQLLNWLYQLAGALHYMHDEMKTYHRDLKPENLMFTESRHMVKIIDLGLATATQSRGYAKTIVGTRDYFSYEKAIGATYDGRDDIWALGLTFSELLTGKSLEERGGAFFVAELNAEIKKKYDGLIAECINTASPIASLVQRMLVIKQEGRINAHTLVRACASLLDRGSHNLTSSFNETADEMIPLDSLTAIQLKALLETFSLSLVWKQLEELDCTGHDLALCENADHLTQFGITNPVLLRRLWDRVQEWKVKRVPFSAVAPPVKPLALVPPPKPTAPPVPSKPIQNRYIPNESSTNTSGHGPATNLKNAKSNLRPVNSPMMGGGSKKMAMSPGKKMAVFEAPSEMVTEAMTESEYR